MSPYSVLVPQWPLRPNQVLPYAALAERTGGRLWLGQTPVGDPYQAFVFASASGFRTPVGTGVSVMPYRHPYDAALQAQSAAVLLGHPVVAGFGPGPADVQRAVLGAAYRSPLTAVREYLTIVRRLTETGECEFDGEYFHCRAVLPSVVRPPVELGLGVLRPRMARLAGEVADVAITWLAPASYIGEVLLPELRAGAAAADRPAPRVVAMVPVALTAESRDPLDLALASSRVHLGLPHYAGMLREAGIDPDLDDPRRAASALMDGGAFLSGDSTEVIDRLTEFTEAGVDEIVLNSTGVCLSEGHVAALADLKNLLGRLVL
ncbi:5,10-methylene tetrahydromethanopterin reductase [Amycolatopsis antarctica]|uniref:5,10-methylene tetrahydromethanopterin reductase n=1 Tax=Amycolatopsis antarctica TaxID=1854586 RepID=A0A263D4C9_9PSEU|nr:LLM class flavin-dependent oxidoreductase [Amycolatopsis antarctica]OZM73049.1 5,10-methylene tetrahydromethanopterin reductase [Amycolatopsis antarctica]